MSSETLGGAIHTDRHLLARSLGALIAVKRFDSPIHLARAVHGATLALAMFAEELAASDMARLKELRRTSLEIGLSVESPGIRDADREWLLAIMRAVLGKAGETQLAKDRLH